MPRYDKNSLNFQKSARILLNTSDRVSGTRNQPKYAGYSGRLKGSDLRSVIMTQTKLTAVTALIRAHSYLCWERAASWAPIAVDETGIKSLL